MLHLIITTNCAILCVLHKLICLVCLISIDFRAICNFFNRSCDLLNRTCLLCCSLCQRIACTCHLICTGYHSCSSITYDRKIFIIVMDHLFDGLTHNILFTCRLAVHCQITISHFFSNQRLFTDIGHHSGKVFRQIAKLIICLTLYLLSDIAFCKLICHIRKLLNRIQKTPSAHSDCNKHTYNVDCNCNSYDKGNSSTNERSNLCLRLAGKCHSDNVSIGILYRHIEPVKMLIVDFNICCLILQTIFEHDCGYMLICGGTYCTLSVCILNCRRSSNIAVKKAYLYIIA